jgi:hypothetical protein
MEYKIIVVKAVGFLGTDFESAGEKLAEEVSRELAAGWEPQGGVCIGNTLSFKTPYLFQAVVRRR